jgi:uncharacterized protein YndB with AHSA1/START domain
MGPISLTHSIDADRERVFDTVCDLALRPSFCDHFQEDYRLARVESSGVGAAARYRVSPPGPGSLWVEIVIAAAERPHLVREHGRCGRLGRIPVITAWEMLEGRGVTDVRLTFWSEPSHPADRARELLGAGGWYRRQWAKALRRLGVVVEGDREPSPVGVSGGDRAWTGVF